VTVQDPKLVDIISVDKQTGNVVLTVSDHLDWSDSIEHQRILQKKLNAYLAFVESGELLQSYPDAKGRQATFKIVFRVKPDVEGLKFLDRAQEIVEAAGFSLRHEIFMANRS
jgi:hypothetical protein